MLETYFISACNTDVCLYIYRHNPWASLNLKTNGNQIWWYMYSGLSHWENGLLIPKILKECTSCNFRGWQDAKTTNELKCQIATNARTHTHIHSTQHMLTRHSEPPSSPNDKPGISLQNSGHQQHLPLGTATRNTESWTSMLQKINQAPKTSWYLLRYIHIGNGRGGSEWEILTHCLSQDET